MTDYKYRGIFTGEQPIGIFEKLVTELRQHILLFCEPKERFNYALCSSDCNRDIQIFKTGPQKISIEWDKVSNGTKITLCYKTNLPDFICKPVGESDYGLDEAKRIMEWTLKRVRSMESTHLYLDHKIWPTQVMNHENMSKISSAKVTIFEANFTSFMEFFNKSRVKKLVLREPVDAGLRYNFVIPNFFFKSDGFKRLEQFSIQLSVDIEEDDFLNCTARTINISSRNLDSQMVIKKIKQWVEGTSNAGYCYNFWNPNGVFDADVIKNGLSATVGRINLQNRKGQTARIIADGTHVYFRTEPYYDTDNRDFM